MTMKFAKTVEIIQRDDIDDNIVIVWNGKLGHSVVSNTSKS